MCPSQPGKVCFLKIVGIIHCLAPQPQGPQSRREAQIPDAGGSWEVIQSSPCFLYSSVPTPWHLPHYVPERPCCLCMTGNSVPDMAGGCTRGQLCHTDPGLYSSLPSHNFDLGILPPPLAACREGKKTERRREGKARRCSCLMFT